MTFIIFRIYFLIIIKNLTKCNILKTFALKNDRKFADRNLGKLCRLSLALASKVVSSTPRLLRSAKQHFI